MQIIKHDLNNRNDVDRIIGMLYPDVPRHVSEMMLEYCKALGLDPFAKPVFAMKSVDSRTRAEKYTIGYTIGFFRIMAIRTGEYGGCDAPVYDYHEGKLVSCTMTVYRYQNIGGQLVRVPCTHTLLEKEFIKKTNGGYGIGDKMPFHMLSVRCEAAVLRKLFPEVLSSHYLKEELFSEEAVSGDFSVVNPDKQMDTNNPVEDQPFGVDWLAPKVDEILTLLSQSTPTTQKWIDDAYPNGFSNCPPLVLDQLISSLKKANEKSRVAGTEQDAEIVAEAELLNEDEHLARSHNIDN